MSRLPMPGSDSDQWGDILNDFLSQAHNNDGSLKSSALAAAGAEQTSNKGVANGYAPLDSSGKVPVSNLPPSAIAGDATTSAKGIVQLAGDLSGTAAAPTVANGAITDAKIAAGAAIARTKLDSSTQTSLTKADNAPTALSGLSDVNISGPADTQVLTYNSSTSKWIPATVSSTTVSDATTGSKGIIQLAGDLAGTAASPTVPGLAAKADDTTVLHKSSNLSDLASASTARTNLGLGTSAVKDVAASGNASTAQVVKGDDTRLSDTVAVVGADPTGVADSATAIQTAINVALGKRVVLTTPGDYLINTSLTGANGAGGRFDLELGDGVRLIQGTDTPVISVSGNATESARSLSVNATAKQNIINCTTSGYAVGDFLLIFSDLVWPTGTKNPKNGEIVRITQIDSGSQLRVDGTLDYSYLTSNNAKAARIPLLQAPRLVGGSIACLTSTFTSQLVIFTRTYDALIRTHTSGSGGASVSMTSCVGFETHVNARDLRDDGVNYFGYGVEAFGPSRDGRVYVIANRVRHAFTTNSSSGSTGVPRHIDVFGVVRGATDTGWDTHEEGEFIRFIDVMADGCLNSGAKHRAPNSEIINPKITNCLGIGIRFQTTANGGRLDGGRIEGATYLGSGSEGIGVRVSCDDVIITGDPFIRNCDDPGIVVQDGANRTRINSATIIAPSQRVGSSTAGIEFQGTSTGHRLGHNITVEGLSSGSPLAIGLLVAASVTDIRYKRFRDRYLTRRISGAARRDDVMGTASAPRTGRYVATSPSSTTATGAASANNLLEVVPFMVGQSLHIDRIGAEITTGGEAGSLIYPVIYDDAGGYPGTLLLNAGTIDATLTNFQEKTVDYDLPWDLIWVGCLYVSAATTRPSMRRLTTLTDFLSEMIGHSTGGAATNPSTAVVGYTSTNVSYATGPPTTFPSGGTVATVAARVAMRAA